MLYFLLIIYSFVIIIYSIRNIKPSRIILYGITGIAALFGLDYIVSYIGMNIPINIFTMLTAAIGGLPSLIMTVTLQWIFN